MFRLYRRLAIACAFCLVLSGPTWAGMVVGSGAATFCTGTELVCLTFEAGTTWDAAAGTADCNLDGNDDYCDGSTAAGTFLFGAKGFGARGSNTSCYVEEALSAADQTEFFVEGWFRWATVGSGYQGLWIGTSTNGVTLRLLWDTDESLHIAVNNGTVIIETDWIPDPRDATWLHIGIYYKQETGTNDGVVAVWGNSGTSEGFATVDLKVNDTAVDTSTSYPADKYRIRAPGVGLIYYDNLRIKAGAPSWPTS